MFSCQAYVVVLQSEVWWPNHMDSWLPATKQDQWTEGNSPSLWASMSLLFLLITEISQNDVSEILVLCLQSSMFVLLLILEMPTGHCSQTPQLFSPKQVMALWTLPTNSYLFFLPTGLMMRTTDLCQPRKGRDQIVHVRLSAEEALVSVL